MTDAIRPMIPQILITPDRRPPKTQDTVPPQGFPKPDAVLSADPEKAVLEPRIDPQKVEEGKNGFWGRDGFGFDDLIDFINPLQHIPVVSTIYRAITGDEIGVGPRMFGGAVLGGVIGVGMSAVNAAIEYETGKDIGETVLASAIDIGSKAMDVATGGEEAAQQVASAAKQAVADANIEPQIASAQAAPTSTVAEEGTGAADVTRVGLEMQTPVKDAMMAQILGVEKMHQSYRNAQFQDMLQKTAMDMEA